MTRIHLLDDSVIDKIAAGEVVERPASVVKELVENAIDAGAKSIRVELEDGGIQKIVVTDDGCGMTREDAELSVRRHCTSKISRVEDIFEIGSMGFRGEALASIASVSRFTLTTAPRPSSPSSEAEPEGSAAEGVRIEIRPGGESSVRTWPAIPGTTISIEELFAGFPARKKFLKSGSTEYSHCRELVQALALVHPSIAFTLIHNGKEQFYAPITYYGEADSDETPRYFGETALKERIRQVFDKTMDGLLYLTEESDYGRLEALVSPPGTEKPTSKYIYGFVNGRWVKDKTLRFGLLRGYHSHLLKGKYPRAIALLTVDPGIVDVNVHPSKTELRFQYPAEIQGLLALGIRKRIREGDWATVTDMESDFFRPVPDATDPVQAATAREDRPSSPFSSSLDRPESDERGRPEDSFRRPSFSGGLQERSASSHSVSSGHASTNGRIVDGATADGPIGSNPSSFKMADRRRESFRSETEFDRDSASVQAPGSDCGSGTGTDSGLSFGSPTLPGPELLQGFSEEGSAPASTEADIDWTSLKWLGSFGKCYLFFDWHDKLLVVDQHAFHERILFERLTTDSTILQQRQKLIIPDAIALTREEIAALASRKDELGRFGFEYAIIDETTIEVRAIPVLLAGKDLEAVFSALALGEEGVAGAESRLEDLSLIPLATIACHSAVRAGEELDQEEVNRLLGEATGIDFLHNCPHGRRVLRVFSKRQVSAWFDRT